MENESKDTRWDYLEMDGRTKVPIIQAELIIANKSYKYTFVLDTGYDGEILVPYVIYNELKLHRYELPRNLWSIGETISGERVSLVMAICKVRVQKFDFECLVETFKGNNEFLVGLSFIKKFITTLHGKKEKCCLKIEK